MHPDADPPPLLAPAALRALAAQHGFDDVGVTGAAAHPEAGRLFRAWLERGRQATMTWLTPDPRRWEPRRHMPDARSVLTLAVNHYRPAGEPAAGHGRVARYAAGEDYHRVLDRGLRALIAALRQHGARGFRG